MSTKMLRGLEHLCCEVRLGTGAVHSREVSEKTSEHLPVPKSTRELNRDFLQGQVVIGHAGMTSD